MEIILNEEQIEALSAVVEYLYHDERKGYSESGYSELNHANDPDYYYYDDTKPDGEPHIFCSVWVLNQALPEELRSEAEEPTPISTYKINATVFKPVAQTHVYQVTGVDSEEAYSKATEELLNRLKQSGQSLKKVSYEIDLEEISDEADEPEVEDEE